MGEQILGYCVVGIATFIFGIVLSSCWSYRKQIKENEKLIEKENSSVEISLEEITKFLQDIDEKDNDKPLDELVIKWLNEKTKANMLDIATPYVYVEEECIGDKCERYPTRTDCCDNEGWKTGKCKVLININKICNVEDYIKNPKLLTPNEVKVLSQIVTEYLENKNE